MGQQVPYQNNVKVQVIDKELPSEIKSLKPIKVLKSLRNPHPFIRKTEKVLSKTKPDEYGVVNARNLGCLYMRVSPKLRKRSYRIMNAILKCFEDLGFELVMNEGYFSETCVIIHDQKIAFSLNEKVRRIDHVPTKKEVEEQKKWSDTARIGIEARLNEFVINAFKIAKVLASERQEEEKQQN